MRAISEFLIALVLFCACMTTQAQTNTPANASASASATAPIPNSANSSINLNIAGHVDLVEGDVHIYDTRNAVRIVHVNDNIFEGDSIVTGSDGEIHITMADTGFIAVRPNTKMTISQYRANGDSQDKGVIGLLVGSFRSISGWIAKYQPKSYEIRTPTATIGIRGTDHEPKVIPEDSTEGEPGTYDKVNAGGTYIQTPQGTVNVTENHAAFAPRGGPGAIARPRLLDRVPNFYRPTRNEHFIEGKHAEIQRNMSTRRSERFQQYRNSPQRQQDQQRSMQELRMRQQQANSTPRQNMMNRQENTATNHQRMDFAQRMQAARSAMAERQQRIFGNRAQGNQSTNNRLGENQPMNNRIDQIQRGNRAEHNTQTNPGTQNQYSNRMMENQRNQNSQGYRPNQSNQVNQRNTRTLPNNNGKNNVRGTGKEEEKPARGQKAE